jgi:hypothetical protein
VYTKVCTDKCLLKNTSFKDVREPVISNNVEDGVDPFGG